MSLAHFVLLNLPNKTDNPQKTAKNLMPRVARGHPEQIVAKKESCLEFLKN